MQIIAIFFNGKGTIGTLCYLKSHVDAWSLEILRLSNKTFVSVLFFVACPHLGLSAA